MSYNLRHDDASPSPVTQTLEAWGISNVVVTERSFAPGTLTFDIAGDFDTAPPFAYGERITLLEGSTVRWTGRVRQLPQSARGENEVRSYVAEDVLGDLARRTFLQPWKIFDGVSMVEATQAMLVLFRDVDNNGVQISGQVENIIAAASAAGIAVQFGTAASMAVQPQAIDGKAMTFLEALKLVAKLVPDAATQIDHTTTPPTLSIVRRVDADEHSLAVIDNADEFDCTALHDQQVSAVVLTYQKQAVVSGIAYTAIASDVHPPGSTGEEENALVATTELRGASPPQSIVQEQYIETELIDPDEFAFWERIWPDIANRNLAATLEDGEIVDAPDEDRLIIDGAQPAWTGTAKQITVKALFNGVVDGVTYLNKLLVATVNASTLSTGTYSQTTEGQQYDPGESVPSGLASLLYSALNPLQYSGSFMRVESELGWSIRVGDALNFTGTDDTALTTARASVQSIRRNLDTGTVSYEFGPPPWLSFDDLIDLLRSTNSLQSSVRSDERAGNGNSNTLTVEGSGMGPGWSLVPQEPVATHPFKVTRIGTTGDDFRVEAGQIDGYTIAAQTIDVGSSRPVSIRIKPVYSLSIYNSEFVYAATLSTSPTAPTLEASATLSDVTAVTSVGDEARCVIATISSLNVVSQIATGNVVSTLQDDGTLNGEATVSYNKAS